MSTCSQCPAVRISCSGQTGITSWQSWPMSGLSACPAPRNQSLAQFQLFRQACLSPPCSRHLFSNGLQSMATRCHDRLAGRSPEASKPRHEPSAAPLSPGPLDLGSRAQPGRAVAPRFRQAKLGPHAQSQATQREKCIQDWQDLLAQLGSCSITFVAAAASQDPYAAFEASLRAYTPSTIAQYFRCFAPFWHLSEHLDSAYKTCFLCT